MALSLLSEFITFDVLSEQFLIEANILNIKDKNGQETSIHEFLKQYTDALSTIELKNAFVKKVANLLINDERFHEIPESMPADAPDWAKKAYQERQLY